jgi:hypothetical protein
MCQHSLSLLRHRPWFASDTIRTALYRGCKVARQRRCSTVPATYFDRSLGETGRTAGISMPSTPTKLQDHLEVGCPVSVDLLSCDIMAQRCERSDLVDILGVALYTQMFQPQRSLQTAPAGERVYPALHCLPEQDLHDQTIQSTLMPTA